MARMKSAGATTFLTLLLSTTALHADVTPQEVWEGWQKQYAAYGLTVTPGEVDDSGDTLVISDLVLSSETTTGTETKVTSKTSITVPELILEDQGDGTVTATIGGVITGTNETTNGTEPAEVAKFSIDDGEASTTISGTADEMSYEVDAPLVKADLEAQPTAKGAPPTLLTMAVTGMTGTQSMSNSGGQAIRSDIKASGMKLHMTGTDAEESSTVTVDLDLSDLVFKGDNLMPEGADASKLGEAIAKGMHTSSDMSYGAMSFKMDATTKDGPVNVSGTAQSGHATVGLSREAVRYAASGSNTAFEVQTMQFPMPMKATVDQGEIDFAFPMAATTESQPFTGKIGLVGLNLSEQIWGLFDPTAKLDHGPATLIIDLTGKGKTLIDLFSPAAAAAQVPPVQIDSLNVNKVQLTAAGAELTGNGALTFDNSMGMPMPLGAVDLKLAGSNKLMDGLVAMGVIPQDQVMFGKMMLGLYAVPVGDDLFTSKIEFKEGGKILANGQPIQ